MAEAAKTDDEGADKTSDKTSKGSRAARRAKEPKTGGSGKGGSFDAASARKLVATAVWVLAVVAALVLALGALVIALDFNTRNGLVDFLITSARKVNVLGELKTFDAGKSDASKHDALVKTVLVNWGICAVVYLVVGKFLDRLIRP